MKKSFSTRSARSSRHTTPRARLARRLLAERLETRQMFDGNADDLTPLSDEFDDAASIDDWQEINDVEGWGPRGAQLDEWSVNAGGSGQMLMQPQTVVWYEDWRGPLVFKEVTGDFVITTRLTITDRDDIGGADADNVPGDGQFSLGGLMIRTPRSIQNGAADWVPGSHANDGNVGENYVFLSMGYTIGENQFSFEAKTTRNSTSNLELTPVGLEPNSVELRIARIGSSIIALHRLEGTPDWTVHRRYSRPDMPETLQVGMVTYSDWEKANDWAPIVHNGTVLDPSLVADPTPEQPFSPDLTANFDYARFARPQVPAELAGVDLVQSATDAQLLSFLGDPAQPPEPHTTHVGMNLSGLVDWDPAWVFRDAFTRARPWAAQARNIDTGNVQWQSTTGEGPALAVDNRGWVTALPTWQHSDGTWYQQVATTVLFAGDASQPAGIYRAEWDGEGQLEMPFVVESGVTAAGRHYALVDMPAGAHFTMAISSTDVSNPIRNINFWMPDFAGQSLVGDWAPGAATSPFHPLFLDRLEGFDTLRFMDWMNTNQTDVVTWDDRRHWDDATQSDGDLPQYYHTNGVAPEYMIELANELDANPWFNMPYLANDDYVRNFAELVRDSLEPGRTVYVEWSNELWNGFFPTYHWLVQQTQLPENAGLDFFQVAGREMRRDFEIWTEVFAGQEDRLVRVVAGQQANSWLTEQLLANVDGQVDAVSCTAYAGIGYDMALGYDATTTADDILDDLINVSIPWASARLQEHAQLVEQYEQQLGRDLQFVTYESGSHVFGDPNPFPWSPALDAALAAASSPRMYDVYQALLSTVNTAGVDLYNEFTFTGSASAHSFGSYGVLTDMTTPLDEAHKLRALLDFAASQTGDPPPNTAPVLDAILDRIVNEESLVSFQVAAADADNDTLTFVLGPGAPEGAAIDPESGSFVWIPSADQGPGVYEITIVVQDDGSPVLEDSATFTITVLDVPRVTIDDGSLLEGDSGVLILSLPVNLSAAADAPVTLSYTTEAGTATAGSDYIAKSGTVVFAPGETLQTIEISVRSDRRDEFDESFVVRLSNAIGALIDDDAAIATIVDNDPLAKLSVSSTSIHEADNESVIATLTVRLSAASGKPVGVHVSTVAGTASAGQDFDVVDDILLFAPGETSKTVDVVVHGDLLDELNETLSLLLSDAENAQITSGIGRITIVDNDPRPTLSIGSATILEGESGFQEIEFTVQLSSPSGRAIAVNYLTLDGTAKVGLDYAAASGTLVFEPGETSKTVRIRVIGDRSVENDETFRVRLFGAVGAGLGQALGTGHILNDDFFTALGT